MDDGGSLFHFLRCNDWRGCGRRIFSGHSMGALLAGPNQPPHKEYRPAPERRAESFADFAKFFAGMAAPSSLTEAIAIGLAIQANLNPRPARRSGPFSR